jgi:hypothetical protein
MNETTPMMKCGCAAQGLRHMPDGSKVPSCITHNCIEADAPPDLSGRKARCDYYGRSTGRHNECNYGQSRSDVCTCEQPSSTDLPFFKFLGSGSAESMNSCKCGLDWIAHQPYWRAHIEVDQQWYKNPREKQINHKQFYAPVGMEKQKAEAEAEFWRSRIGSKSEFNAPVFGVEVVKVEPINSPCKCKQFTPKGAQPFDKFYCGCHSWD